MSSPEAARSSRMPRARPQRLTVIDRKSSAGRSESLLGAAERGSAGWGPLLAVCGLCGGAGASTLAYLTALDSARRHSGAVLVCDTGGPTGGLADRAGTATPRSLPEVAEQLSTGLQLGCVYALGADGVRVLATSPRFAPGCDRDGIKRVLEHARAAHALTVVDCGTLTREADRIALDQASHVAWVLPATPGGVRRGARVLDALDLHPPPPGRELVVARRDTREPKAALGDVKRLAEQRNATLILVPHIPGLHGDAIDAALDSAQVALQAIEGLLAR